MGLPCIQESADHLKWEVLRADCSATISAKEARALGNTSGATQMVRVLETLC